MTNYKTTYYPNPRTMCFVISLALLAALDSVAGKMLYKLQYSKQLRLWCLLFRFMNMSHSFETQSFLPYTQILSYCSYRYSSFTDYLECHESGKTFETMKGKSNIAVWIMQYANSINFAD